MDKGQTKLFFSAFYLAAMVLVVFYAWNTQNTIRKGGSTPLYRNLMEQNAYIKRGFNLSEINLKDYDNEKWVRCQSIPPKVIDSPLPDLPKRPFLSPMRGETEEFTIIIPVEMDNEAMAYRSGRRGLVENHRQLVEQVQNRRSRTLEVGQRKQPACIVV
jgi:hypothetical protein